MPLPDLAQLLPLVALLVLIGALAGVIAGLLGVGGGIVLVPAFLYTFQALGYDGPRIMQVCLATSLATIVFTSQRSVRAHAKKGAVDMDILRGWGPGIAIGAVVGMLVAGSMKTTALMLIFGVLGTLVGLYLAFGRDNWRFGDHMPTGIGRAITSPVLGFFSVLMGIGGGSFGVPLMRLYERADPPGGRHRLGLRADDRHSLGDRLPAAGLGRPGLPPFTVGLVNMPAFLVVIGVTMITTTWGVRLAHAMNPRPLKLAFAAFIMLMALNMLRKALIG